MTDIKNLLAVIAIILTFVGYAPYIRDVISRKTTPHLYSWFLWGFGTGSIVFALQLAGNAGFGAFVTLAAVSLCILVFFLGLKNGGTKEITKTDTLFLIMAIIALLIWLVAKQPVLSAILVTIIDLLGFVPTIRKSWKKPFSETLSFYYLNSFRFLLAFLAVQNYSIITAFYPAIWMVANGLFGVMLSVRRKQVATRSV